MSLNLNLKPKQVVLAVTAAVTVGATGLAAAAPVTLRLSTAAPEKTIWGTQMARFAADVLEASKGDVKVDVFYGSQLGNEQDATQQTMRGRIDLTLVSISGLASQVPETTVSKLSSFYDKDDRDCIFDQHLTKPIAKLLDDKNLHMVGWFETGTAGTGAKKKITSPADIRNVKLAIGPNKFDNALYALYGAVPVATPAAEYASSIGSGLTDATPVQPTYYVAAGISKVAPIWNFHVPNTITPAILVMSKSVFEKLTPEQRNAITAAAAKVPATQIRKELQDFEAVMLKKHLDAGGQIFEPTPAEMAEWKKPLDAFYEKQMKEISPAAVELYATAKAGKLACKK